MAEEFVRLRKLFCPIISQRFKVEVAVSEHIIIRQTLLLLGNWRLILLVFLPSESGSGKACQ